MLVYLKWGMILLPIRSIEFLTLVPIGDPTTNWPIPIFCRAAIFSMHMSGVPHIEKASSISGVTAANAFGKSPALRPARISSALATSILCFSSTGGGLPATIKATTGVAAFTAFFGSSLTENDV